MADPDSRPGLQPVLLQKQQIQGGLLFVLTGTSLIRDSLDIAVAEEIQAEMADAAVNIGGQLRRLTAVELFPGGTEEIQGTVPVDSGAQSAHGILVQRAVIKQQVGAMKAQVVKAAAAVHD